MRTQRAVAGDLQFLLYIEVEDICAHTVRGSGEQLLHDFSIELEVPRYCALCTRTSSTSIQNLNCIYIEVKDIRAHSAR